MTTGRAEPCASRDPAGRGNVTVVGVGPGDPAYITERAKTVISAADVVSGFAAALELARPHVRGEMLRLDYAAQDQQLALLARRARQGQRCAVCIWGDPSVSSGELVARIRRAVGEIEIVSGVSAALVACARAALALEETLVVSLHRREGAGHALAELVAVARARTRSVIVFPRPYDLMPRALAGELLAAGLDPATEIIVFERLTLADERAHHLALTQLAALEEPFSDLSLVVLRAERSALEDASARAAAPLRAGPAILL